MVRVFVSRSFLVRPEARILSLGFSRSSSSCFSLFGNAKMVVRWVRRAESPGFRGNTKLFFSVIFLIESSKKLREG